MRKKTLFLALFTMLVLCCKAQFVLTPSGDLLTEDGSYVIQKIGAEEENYEAVEKAIKAVLPNAQISEDEYMKSFSVRDVYKTHAKLPGALKASDWEMNFSFRVEVDTDKIMITFNRAEAVKAHFGSQIGGQTIYPYSGKNSMLTQMGGVLYLFNSKGKVSKGGKKMKAFYEDHANGIVNSIENNLK